MVETILSINPDDLYDVVAINAASASTQLSGLPFSGPIGGVRIALIDDGQGAEWVAFPKHSQLQTAIFNMVVVSRVVGDDVAVMMVEAEATNDSWKLIKEQGKQAPTEDIVSEGLEAAKPFIKVLCEAQASLVERAKQDSVDVPIFKDYQDDVLEAVTSAAEEKLTGIYQIADKQQRESADAQYKSELVEELAGEGKQFEGRGGEVGKALGAVTKQVIRQRILRDQFRIDGRGLTDIRQLTAEVEVLPRVHGSAIFERGETQIMGVTTLNMLKMEQTIDSLSPENTKRYMHNYNFPPYSTGETGRVGSRSAARSDTAPWQSAPWCRCCPRVRSSLRDPPGL